MTPSELVTLIKGLYETGVAATVSIDRNNNVEVTFEPPITYIPNVVTIPFPGGGDETVIAPYISDTPYIGDDPNINGSPWVTRTSGGVSNVDPESFGGSDFPDHVPYKEEPDD